MGLWLSWKKLKLLSATMYLAVGLALVFSILCGIFLSTDYPSIPQTLFLGSEDVYEWKILSAPSSNGVILDVASLEISKSIFGPLLKRLLLRNNNIHNLRELAVQVHDPPMYFPVKRLQTYQRDVHAKLAKLSNNHHSFSIEAIASGECNEMRSVVKKFSCFYRSGKITPTQVMTKALATVVEWEMKGFKIFSSILKDDVLRQARESDERYARGAPLSVFDGVPIVVKDMIDVNGHTIYFGRDPNDSKNRITSLKDDSIVERFRAIGAIIFGVTIMTEGGVTPLGFNAHFQGPTSIFSSNRYSGGSSSGSGVAVASGLVPVAIGFDSGGSIRVPASMSGMHGLAATFGRIPFENVTDGTFIRSGPIAASAEDAALAYLVMAPNKPNHFYSVLYDGDVQGPPPPHLHSLDDVADLSDVRLGLFDAWFDDSDEEVRRVCRAAVDALVVRGATVVPVAIPHLPWLSLGHGVKIASEFALTFDEQMHQRLETVEANTRITAGIGGSVSALEVLSAERLRAWAFNFVDNLFTQHNLTCIVTPTVPVLPPVLAEAAKARGELDTALVMKVMKYVFLANFVGMPGYSVPVGSAEARDVDGGHVRLPVGLHLLGAHWSEHKLLRLANALDAIGAGAGAKAKGVGEAPLKRNFVFDPFTA